jgi:MFS family permease
MRGSIFYGYVILALCFFNMVLMRGVTGSFSVFYVALLEEFSWSHGSGATIASINFLVYALAAPLVGLAFDRLGPRFLMPAGGLFVATGLYLSSFSHSLGDLYLSYGIITALGQGALGFVGHNALISHWFVRRRATAIGIATMGQGLGALLIVPLTQVFISNWGWRTTFTIIAGLILFGVVPANALLQRRHPAEVGQLPDGAPREEGTEPGSKRREAPREWTLRSAVSSFPFWSITVGHLALGVGLFMLFTHVVAHLVHVGFGKLAAAFVLGLIGFIRIGGTVVWGFASDRLGRDKAYGIATFITLIGIGFLVAVDPASPVWFAYAAALFYGIGHSAGNPTYGALIGDIFGGRSVGLIFGFLEISFGLGSSFGAWIGGYLFDLTGSYRWPFSLCFLTFTISYLAVQTSFNWQSRQDK